MDVGLTCWGVRLPSYVRWGGHVYPNIPVDKVLFFFFFFFLKSKKSLFLREKKKEDKK